MKIIKNTPSADSTLITDVPSSNPTPTVDDSSANGRPLDSSSSAKCITAIKPALRDTHRVNIFINDKYSFSLDLAQLADYKLKVGQQLSNGELEKLISASNFGKLYTSTLKYVLSRPHSIKEVRDYLHKKQHTRLVRQRRYEHFKEKLKSDPTFRQQVQASRLNNHHSKGYPTKPSAPISSQDIDNVIERLMERGYLNDEIFTRYYIENRNLKKGISPKKLRLELRQKGISDDTIDQAIASSSRSQSDEIKKIIEKRRRRGYDDQKLIQYLLCQGFDYELVRNLVLDETD